MSDGKIEIKVTRDASQQDVHIDSMSIGAAISFSKIFNSLVQILESTPGCEDAKLQLVDGSAAAVVDASPEAIELIYDGFEATRSHKCTNSKVVTGWRDIQTLFKANGLGYEATFYKGDKVISVVEIMKHSKAFKTKSLKTESDTTIKFFETKLIEVGGKSPNVHFLGDNEEKITASCTQQSALVANRFLYQDIKLSVWKTEKENKRPSYELCDVYVNGIAFTEIRTFIEAIEAKDDVELLMDLHKELKSKLQINDETSLRRVARIMRIYSHPETDINKIKTILLITKSFKEREEIFDMWNLLYGLYRKAYRKL